MCYLDAPDLTRLDLAAVLVEEVLGHIPYLVGSVLTTPDYRDVDVRAIMPDERFDELFKRVGRDPLRDLIEVALTEHFVRHTGLRIDFQIQRRTDSQKHEGVRHPLGLYPYPSTGDEA
jgi:hypothetical protein